MGKEEPLYHRGSSVKPVGVQGVPANQMSKMKVITDNRVRGITPHLNLNGGKKVDLAYFSKFRFAFVFKP